MDAVGYLKARRRMLGEFCYKNNCGACKLFACCDCETDEQIEQDIKIVEQWAKENPIKTYKDALLELFPDAELDCLGYPMTKFYHLMPRKLLGSEFPTFQYYDSCWDAEFKGWS